MLKEKLLEDLSFEAPDIQPATVSITASYVDDKLDSIVEYKDLSQFEHDYLLSVISQRISIGKSNIFTTNYSLPIIEQRLGTRLASRIIGSCIKIEFKGKDKRSWGIK